MRLRFFILLLACLPVLMANAAPVTADSIPVDTVLLDDGSLYMGQIRDSLFNGYGICIYPDGTVYQGDWKDGLWEGQGTLVYPDGDIYKGEFHNHIKEGKGTYIYGSGARYDGEWKDDRFNGKGRLRFEDGGIYDGMWKDDMKHGYGKLTSQAGRSTTGYFYFDEFLGMPFDTTIDQDSTLTDELKEWGFEKEPKQPQSFLSAGISYGFNNMLTATMWFESESALFFGLSIGFNAAPPVHGMHSGLGWQVMSKDIHMTGTYISPEFLADAGFKYKRLALVGAVGLGIVKRYQNCKADTNSGQYFGSYDMKYGDPYYRIGFEDQTIAYRGYVRYSIHIKNIPKAYLQLGYGNADKLFMGLGLIL